MQGLCRRGAGPESGGPGFVTRLGRTGPCNSPGRPGKLALFPCPGQGGRAARRIRGRGRLSWQPLSFLPAVGLDHE